MGLRGADGLRLSDTSPDGTRTKANGYYRLLAREKDLAVGTRHVKHPGMPCELRNAADE